jgi:serine/threonine protein kinase
MGTRPPEEEGFDAPTLVRSVSGVRLLLGTILGGQYQIEDVIGEGGIGIVYRARQLTVGRHVAIKVLRKQYANDDLAVRRFENEATAISRLRHPNTLRLYDCQRTPDGDLYIVTELLTGSPLSDVLKRELRLPIHRAVRTLDEVCRSLAEAHAAGIVHRDLKPPNIFLDRIGNEDVVKVLDFGIAKILQTSSTITRAGAVPGTPHYMSPEHATASRIDHRADIYSLGVILFQMVAGVPPFEGTAVIDILQKHITDPPPSLKSIVPDVDVPPELERLVHWMLAKSPDERPQSVDEIRNHLPGILAVAAPATPPGFAPSSASPPPSLDLIESAETQAEPLPPIELTARAEAPRILATVPPSLFSSASVLRWRAISALAGVLGIVVGFLIGFSGSNERVVVEAKPEVAVAPPEPATRVETAAASTVAQAKDTRVTLTSDPPGAAVIAPDGQRIGTTPLSVNAAEARTYLLLGDGMSNSVLIDPEADAGKTVSVRLHETKKKKAPASPRPAGRAKVRREKRP